MHTGSTVPNLFLVHSGQCTDSQSVQYVLVLLKVRSNVFIIIKVNKEKPLHDAGMSVLTVLTMTLLAHSIFPNLFENVRHTQLQKHAHTHTQIRFKSVFDTFETTV